MPHRMGAVLTCARRCALLAGIAREDDLDAPDVVVGSPPAEPRSRSGSRAKQGNDILQRRPPLTQDQSAKLRDQMLARSGLQKRTSAARAKDGLSRKNPLLDADA
jgi:hypothetical protein